MRERFDNLQILRGIACLSVVVYHMAEMENLHASGGHFLRPVLWFGYAGVDLFFVLSGFLIASTNRHELGQAAALPRYLFRRLWRIYPTFWAAFILAVCAYPLYCTNRIFGLNWQWEFVQSVLLLPQDPCPRLLPAAWTLSYEVMFYLAFAVLFLLPRRMALPALLVWGVIVLHATIMGHWPRNQYTALPFHPVVLEFVAGALLAWCPLRLSGRVATLVTLVALAWCVIGTILMFDPDPHWVPWAQIRRVRLFGVPAALLVFALIGWERSGGRLKWTWLNRLGDASYSVYLTHFVSFMLIYKLANRVNWPQQGMAHLGWLAALLAGSLGLGFAFHRRIERPLLGLAKPCEASIRASFAAWALPRFRTAIVGLLVSCAAIQGEERRFPVSNGPTSYQRQLAEGAWIIVRGSPVKSRLRSGSGGESCLYPRFRHIRYR